MAIKTHPFFHGINWPHLEAGILKPPFEIDPHAVYAKDVLDIEQFSTVKGVTIDQDDSEFYSKFASGCTTKPWMNEMIETGVFDLLNSFGPNDEPTEDLIEKLPTEGNDRRGFFSRLFGRRVSIESGVDSYLVLKIIYLFYSININSWLN
jgi:G protein-coupled receptor kinase